MNTNIHPSSSSEPPRKDKPSFWRRLVEPAAGVENIQGRRKVQLQASLLAVVTPLLVVNTSEIDFVNREEDLEDLIEQIRNMERGVQYYVPLGSRT